VLSAAAGLGMSVSLSIVVLLSMLSRLMLLALLLLDCLVLGWPFTTQLILSRIAHCCLAAMFSGAYRFFNYHCKSNNAFVS
jgi:uncharacterized membrane protein